MFFIVRIEGYYYYKITDNLGITSDFFIVLNPENNNANNTVFVGLVSRKETNP